MEEISDSNVSTPIPLYILRIIIITASFSSPPSHPLPSSSPLPGSHPLSHTPSIKHSPCTSCRASGAAFHHRPLLLPYFTPIAPSPSYANSAAPRLRGPGGVAEPPTIGAPGGGFLPSSRRIPRCCVMARGGAPGVVRCWRALMS